MNNKNNKLKVIHVYKDFDTYNGLIETFLFIAKYFNREQFDLSICVFNYEGGSYGKKFEELGGKIYNLHCGHGVKGYLNTMRRLTAYLKQKRPDIVVTHDRRGNFLGIPAAKLAHVPVIISTETTLKDSATTILRRLRDRVIHPVLFLLVSASDAFVANSEIVKRQWMFKAQASKYKVIYPPFNLGKFHEIVAPGREPSGAGRHYPTLGFIGRLSEEKGLHHLIRIIPDIRKKFPSIKLFIAGAGQLDGYYKSLVIEKSLEDNVSFCGFQNNSFEFLKQVDLLVIPSRTEGFGIAALEAMAMGIPVIASRVGGLQEIVTDSVGILISPGDEKELTKAIITLLSDRKRLQEMGEKGHRRAFEEFHPMRYIKRFEQLYIDLLEKKGVLPHINA